MNSTLSSLLDQLIQNWESEVVEFKRDLASDKSSTHLLGKYFSALANESNLRNKNCGWLVLGVDDKTQHIVGCSYGDTPTD